ncbi:heterokaryon incompatibility protein-domain-containing protein [Xylaria sp. FL1777]|nr:heterokaryon incompatibility protein-domain-containing protein [Xylaria sp. FL1777]
MASDEVRKIAFLGEDSTAEQRNERYLHQNLESSYEYSALLYPDSIRVFVLKASVDTKAPIHGEIDEHRLSDERAELGYIALSYAWGSRKETHAIHIGDYELRIGQSLNSALRNLRRKDRPIRLWVDALCINQDDIIERNHQVQQMRSIYSSASETLIYLGDEMGGNVEFSAWNFLERHAAWAMNENHDADLDLPAKREAMTSFRGELSDVEIDVLRRSWFKRLWVFQEVVVSKTLSIQCGGRRISWDDFCHILLLSTRYHDRYGFSIQLLERIEVVRDMFQARCSYQELHGMARVLPPWRALVQTSKHNTLDILNLLQRARPLEASDPRDKIFGLLGVASGIDLDDQRFAIDYSEDCGSVYTRFARSIIDATRSYDILSHVGHGLIGDYGHLGYDTHRNGLPSWVPDWDLSRWRDWSLRNMRTILSTLDSRSVTEGYEDCQSSEGLFCDWDESGTVLIASGSVIGQISNLSNMILLSSVMEMTFQKIRDSAGSEKAGQDLIMEVWGKKFALKFSASYKSFDMERCSEKGTVEYHLLARAHKNVSWADGFSTAPVTVDEASIVDGKRIAEYSRASDMKGLAIVPADACIGDSLVDLQGGRVPFLVRMYQGSLEMETKSMYSGDAGENQNSQSSETDTGLRQCQLIGEAVVNRASTDTPFWRERVFLID